MMQLLELELRKVFIVDASVGVTGAFKCAANIAGALQGRFETSIFLPKLAQVEALHAKNFKSIEKIHIRNIRRSIWALVIYLPFLLFATLQLLSRMRQKNVQVLIMNDFYLMHGALAKMLGFRGKLITWVRVSPDQFGFLAKVWLYLAKAFSDEVICVSKFIQNQMPIGMSSKLVFDAIEVSETQSSAFKPNLKFVFVGNYVNGKGQDVAIDALAIVTRKFPDATLHFFGGDLGLDKNVAFKDNLRAQANRLKLSENVFFGDFCTDVFAALDGKFASINMSKSESFSMTVLEASAVGLPIVASKSGGPQEIIADKETGFLVGVGDVNACAEAMLSLCRDPQLAREMGKLGAQRIRDKFSFSSFRQSLVEII